MSEILHLSQLDMSKKYTYADYLMWEFKDRVELIKGIIVKMSPAPRRRHQDISSNVYSFFKTKLTGTQCKVYYAPFDVRLASNSKETDTVVQPDICIICDPAKLDDLGCAGAPDLIVEILSPGNKRWDEVNKFKLYEENGVREYWIIDPEIKVVKVYLLVNTVYELVDYYENEGMLIPVNIFENTIIKYDEVFSE